MGSGEAMTAADRATEGHGGARTAVAQDFGAEVAALLGDLAPQATLPGLTGDEAPAADLLGRVAEQVNAKRRGAGRPQGSANRRNDEVFDYLEARGFKQPERYLAELITADPRELAAALSGPGTKAENVAFDKAMEVLRAQLKAAEALLPYKFAKKQELKVEHSGGQVHLMMAGPLTRPGDTPATAFDLTGGATEIIEHSATEQGAVGNEAVGQTGQAVEATEQSPSKPAD